MLLPYELNYYEENNRYTIWYNYNERNALQIFTRTMAAVAASHKPLKERRYGPMPRTLCLSTTEQDEEGIKITSRTIDNFVFNFNDYDEVEILRRADIVKAIETVPLNYVFETSEDGSIKWGLVHKNHLLDSGELFNTCDDNLLTEMESVSVEEAEEYNSDSYEDSTLFETGVHQEEIAKLMSEAPLTTKSYFEMFAANEEIDIYTQSINEICLSYF